MVVVYEFVWCIVGFVGVKVDVVGKVNDMGNVVCKFGDGYV